MRTTLRFALAAPLLSLLAACSGGADAAGDPYERGLDQAKAGDHAAAVESYDAALADLSAGDDQYLEVLMAKVESMSHTNAADATIAFLAHVDEHGDSVTPADYARVFNWMVAVKSWGQGGKIATALKDAHPDTPEIAAMEDKIAKAMASGEISNEQLEMLKGMGYVNEN